jgi:hypothetical protein
MPIRWPSSPGKSPLVSALLSSIAKTSSNQQALARSSRLPINSASAAARKSTSTKTSSQWASSSSSKTKQEPFQSTFNHLNNLTSLTKSVAIAGTGTFLSTVFALYLATVVETSAHETLYEYFPQKYYGVRDEDLPNCIKDKEMMRRLTGMVPISSRHQGRQMSDSLMSMDGWVHPEKGERSLSVAAELMEEEEFEHVQESQGISCTSTSSSTMTTPTYNLAPWQRKMTEKRARIIEEEEKNSRVGSSWPMWGESTFMSSSKSKSLMERKRVQEEVIARQLQERLMSVAMTA